MDTTDYQGIDYGLGRANINSLSGIRYGVIHQNEVLQSWADSSEPYYGKHTDDFTDDDWECAEPISYFIDDNEYEAECSDNVDIFITRSEYFTYAQFCSPCAPGACYLTSPLNDKVDNNKAYCFGHDWFEDGIAPYPVYSVKTGKIVQSK